MALKVYTSAAQGLKLKVRKSYGLITTFVEVTREKSVAGGRGFALLPNDLRLRILEN